MGPSQGLYLHSKQKQIKRYFSSLLCIYFFPFPFSLPWLKQIVADLSLWRLGFVLLLIHEGYILDKLALGQIFLRFRELFLPVYK